MDVDTAEALERLNDRIDQLEMTLRGEMAGMRDDLRGEMVGMRDELRGEMAGMRDELRAEVAGVRDDLRAELRAGLAANRRHAEILTESVRDDIRLVAEGVAHLAAKIDRM